ncbi:MAG: hypothetical protein ACFB9M_03360 [Myxococcota bacterium]
MSTAARILFVRSLGVWTALGLGMFGCVLPPDGELVPLNVAPIVPSDGIFPDTPVLELAAGRSNAIVAPSIPPQCATTTIQLRGVFDPDSPQVLTRVVANNGSLDEVRQAVWVETSDRRFPLEPGEIFDVVETIDLALTFPFAVLLAARNGFETSRLSVFLTDAPAWEHQPGDPPPEDADYSRILIPDGSFAEEFGITQVDFPILFLQEDRCLPQP